MTTKLFESIIFGPIQSRRLGFSLGINLLPVNSKLCNFNCVYCECGWTDLHSIEKVVFYKRDEIKLQLEKSLIDLKMQVGTSIVGTSCRSNFLKRSSG